MRHCTFYAFFGVIAVLTACRNPAVIPPPALAPPLAVKTAQQEPAPIQEQPDQDPLYSDPALRRRDTPAPLGRLGVGSGLRARAAVGHGTLAPEYFAFAVEDWVFLRQLDDAEVERWGEGATRWLMRDFERGQEPGQCSSVVFGVQPARLQRLPMRWRSWLGRLLLLGRDDEARCHRRVDALAVVSMANASTDEPRGCYFGLEGSALDAAVQADFVDVQDRSKRAPRWLAAHVTALPGQRCDDANWARDAWLDAPMALKIDEVECEHREIRRVWETVRASAAAREWGSDQGGENETESKYDPLPNPQVFAVERHRQERCNRRLERGVAANCDLWTFICTARRFIDGLGRSTALDISFHDGTVDDYYSCNADKWGYLGGWRNVLLNVDRPEPLLLDRKMYSAGRVHAAIDFDGDGVVEWFGGQHFWHNNGHQLVHSTIAWPL